jgi:glycosyltransferase 2 family protein
MRTPVPRNPWVRLALVVLVLVGAGFLLWWRGPSWKTVVDAFEAVQWRWVAAAVGLNLLSTVARALAWRTVIHQAMAPPYPRFRSIFAAFGVGLLANAALPGRMGELARVAVLGRRLPRGRGVWAILVGTVFAHRVFDLVAIMLLIGYVLVAAEIPRWGFSAMLIVVVLGVVLFALALAMARRHQHQPFPLEALGPTRRLVTRARQGLGVMREPLAAATATFFQCVGWFFQLLAVYAAMRAFNIEESLGAAALVLVLMNVATIVTLWPGNVGLLQAAVALPLVAYGIDYAHGFAFGIGLQAIEVSVGVGVGMIFLAREGLSFAMLRHMPEQAEDEEAPRAAVRVETRAPRERARVPG